MGHEDGSQPGLKHGFQVSSQQPASLQRSQDGSLCKQVHVLQTHTAEGVRRVVE